jgi:NADH-quinone oxidoreductase subunit E
MAVKNENEDSQDMEEFINNLIRTQVLDKTKIIYILQQVQSEFGYLSREAMSNIAKKLNIPAIDVFGVATFYAQFRFNKPGKYTIKVCEGTACHVRGGKKIRQKIESELGITPGETTEDGLFSLERVACMGCCALAPVMVVDNEVYGTASPAKVSDILRKTQAEE